MVHPEFEKLKEYQNLHNSTVTATNHGIQTSGGNLTLESAYYAGMIYESCEVLIEKISSFQNETGVNRKNYLNSLYSTISLIISIYEAIITSKILDAIDFKEILIDVFLKILTLLIETFPTEYKEFLCPDDESLYDDYEKIVSILRLIPDDKLVHEALFEMRDDSTIVSAVDLARFEDRCVTSLGRRIWPTGLPGNAGSQMPENLTEHSMLQNALYDACYQNDSERVRVLLERGATVDNQILGAFITCASYSNVHLNDDEKKVVSVLLEYAPIEIINPPTLCKTPLMIASKNNNLDNVLLLLSNGADVNRVSNDGITAVDYAYLGSKFNKNELIVQQLLKMPGIVAWQFFHGELLYRLKKRGYKLSDMGCCHGFSETFGQEFLSYEDSKELQKVFKDRLKTILSVDRENFSSSLDTYYQRYPEKKKEIEPFFDSVVLQQNPEQHKILFEKSTIPSQRNRVAASFFTPASSKTDINTEKPTESNLIMSTPLFSGDYHETLASYFICLQKYLGNFRFSLLLSYSNHAISVSYNPIHQDWLLLDSNYIPPDYQYIVTDIKPTAIFPNIIYIYPENNQWIYCLKAVRDDVFMRKWQNSLFVRTTRIEPEQQSTSGVFVSEINFDALTSSYLKSKITAGKEVLLDKEDSAVRFIDENCRRSPQNNIISPFLSCASPDEISNMVKLNADIFSTIISYKQTDSIAFAEKFAQLQEDPQWLEIHNPDSQNIRPEKWLYLASYSGQKEIVELLLKRQNIDVNKTDINQQTPLFIACTMGNLEVVKLLLSHLNIDVNNINGSDTPLSIACVRGDTDIARALLLNPNIDVNKVSSISANGLSRSTPLCIACMRGYTDIVRVLLLNKNIDVNEALFLGINGADIETRTPLYIACENNDTDIVKALLLNQNIDVNKGLFRSKDGVNVIPLYVACRRGYTNIVKALLLAPNFQSAKSFTDMQTLTNIAEVYKYEEIVYILKEHQLRIHINDLVLFFAGKEELKKINEFNCNLTDIHENNNRTFGERNVLLQELAHSIVAYISIQKNSTVSLYPPGSQGPCFVPTENEKNQTEQEGIVISKPYTP